MRMNSNLCPNRASLKLAFFHKPAFSTGAAVCRPPLARRRLWWQRGAAAGSRPCEQALHLAGDWPVDIGARWENAAFIALWAAGLIGVGLALPF